MDQYDKLLAGALLRAGVFLAAVAAVRPARAVPSLSQVHWIVTSGDVKTLLVLDPKDAEFRFDTPLADLQGNPHPAIPPGWKSTAQGHYTSCGALVRDLAAGTIDPSSIPILLYDNEKWARTPRSEQLSPVSYMVQFTRLAQAHGFVTNMAPDQNLASPVVGNTSYQGGETENWQSYLRLGLAALAARTGTQIVHIMSQPFESRWGPTPERSYVGGEADFVDYVTQAALQAQAANPRVLLTCGLSANRRYRPTAQIMYRETIDVLPLMDGYWLNIWANPMGVDYLRLLDGPSPPAQSSVLFALDGQRLDNALPDGTSASAFSLAAPGSALTLLSSRTYPAGTVIPAGPWEFQFWTDGGPGSAELGLEFGYRGPSGPRVPILRPAMGWTPTVPAAARGSVDAQGAIATTSPTTLPPGGPYNLYWTVTVLKSAPFNLLYGSRSAPTNLATPFIQPIGPPSPQATASTADLQSTSSARPGAPC